MDIMSLLRLIARHWRVTVPAAVVTMALVVVALLLSSPTYAANASVALFSPPTPPEPNEGAASTVGQNPYTRYGDLSVVADIMAQKMASDSEQAKLKAAGVSGYAVVANRLQRGPLVQVTGMGRTPSAAITSAKIVIEEFDRSLAEAQTAEGADPDYFITSGEIQAPEAAVAQVGSTLRTAIAALAVGGLGTLGLAIAAEAVTRRRTASRTGTVDPAVPDTEYPSTAAGDVHLRSVADAARAALVQADPPSGAGRAETMSVGDLGPGARGDGGSGSLGATPRKGTAPVQVSAERTQHRSSQQPSAPEQESQRPSRRASVARKTSQSRPPKQSQPQKSQQPGSEQQPQEWTRWLPRAGGSASTNGHKKPTTDRSA
jgi:hypothetical protein